MPPSFFVLILLCICHTALVFSQTGSASSSPLSEDQGVPSEHLEPITAKQKDGPHKFTGNVGFVSDYRSRGISQTMQQPAIQGELKYTHQSGIYLKTWASNVDGTNQYISNTSMEWDFYVGMTKAIGKSEFHYDVGIEVYYYPGGRALVPKKTSYDTLEYYLAFSYKGLEIQIHETLTDYFGVNSSNPPFNWNRRKRTKPNGGSKGSPYFEINYEKNPFKNFKLFTHIGYQKINNYKQLNYLDWLVGCSYHFDWVDASLYYTQTNALQAFYNIPKTINSKHRVSLGGATIVLGIARSF